MQSGGQRHYTGTIDAWGKIYREEGGKAFFKVRLLLRIPVLYSHI